MEIEMGLVVKAAVIAIVLAVVSVFIMTQSGSQFSQSAANRVFSEKCLLYKSSYACDYEQSISDPGFAEFLGSCRSVYGSERDSYTCLNVFCQPCNENRIDRLKISEGTRCVSICEDAAGLSRIRASSSIYCSMFRSECGPSGVSCDAC